MAQSKAQQAGDEFHMAMGYCIGEWAMLTDGLFALCHAALRTPKQQAAIIFYRTPQIDARLSLTDELIRLALPKHKPGENPHEDLIAWEAAHKRARDLLQVRNRIAHLPVEWRIPPMHWNLDFPDVEADSWFEIYESETERLRHRAAKKPLKIEDLKEHLILTNRARAALHAFRYERLIKHVGEPPR